MSEAAASRILVITAPAGYGKSVLAAQWIAQLDHPVAWLSLRDHDNQPRSFLSALLLAINHALGRTLLTAPNRENTPHESVTLLLDAIEDLDGNLTIVLDDLHTIEDESLVRLIERLYDESPPNLGLVITARSEPKPALARQRAHGNVIDIGAVDLAFTAAESRSFLLRGGETQLSEAQIARINAKAEGWVTGLSLVRLSIRNASPDAIDRLLARIADGANVIEDYLLEEVIRSLGSELRSFVIQASMLDYLDPDLCNAVLQIRNSRSLIRDLTRRNLFIIAHIEGPPRFHHLFAEALRGLLRLEQSDDEIRALHLRAAQHLAGLNDQEGAAAHAISAADWELATSILKSLSADLVAKEKIDTLWYWLRQLPREGLFAASELAGELAYSKAVAGKQREALSILDTVEPDWLAAGKLELVGQAALSRSFLAVYDHDEAVLLRCTLDAVTLIPDSSPTRKIHAQAMRDFALRMIGDREGAAAARAHGNELARRMPIDQPWWIAAAENTEPVGLAIEGRLGDAITYGNYLLTLTQEPTSRVSMHLRNWIADFYLERNDLDTAEQLSTELLQLPPTYWNPTRTYAALSRIAWARNQPEQAMQNIERAIEHARRERTSASVADYESLRAWYWAVQGNLYLASRWASEQRIEDVPWVRRFNIVHPGITLIRLSLEMENPSRAARYAQVLIDESGRRGRWGESVRLFVMQAVAQHAMGNRDEARASLHWAIRYGHSGGYVRSFLDDGAPITEYLEDPLLRMIAPEFVDNLQHLLSGDLSLPGDGGAETPRLSQRELEILKLVADGNTNQHIAERLFIAEPTVRKHLNSAFRKLGVSNRTQAVNRVRQLGLI
jgi:LuxR family maltose regulon positive regulatory protein